MPTWDNGDTRLGLDAEVVVLVYVERDDDMHIISLRRAEKYEACYYFETTKNHFR